MEVVAAAVGVADVAARSASAIWKLCDAWRDAPHEVFMLRDEVLRAGEFYGSLRHEIMSYTISQQKQSAEPPPPPTPTNTTTITIGPRKSRTWHSTAIDLAPETPSAATSVEPSSVGHDHQHTTPTMPRRVLPDSPTHDTSPPPWQPPSQEFVDALTARGYGAAGPVLRNERLDTLLGLIQSGKGVVEELEKVVHQLFVGKDGALPREAPDTAGSPGGIIMQNRRKVLWLVKAPRARKLRSDLSRNMMTTSATLVALNVSNSTKMMNSIAMVSQQTNAHHTDLKSELVSSTDLIASKLADYTQENRLLLGGLGAKLERLALGPSADVNRPDFRRLGSEKLPSMMAGNQSTSSPGMCHEGCTCRCHELRGHSWKLINMTSTLGILSISASKSRFKKATCNKLTCSNHGRDRSYVVTWHLPVALCSATVRLYCAFSSVGWGFDFNLRMGRQVYEYSHTDTILWWVIGNDIPGTRQLISVQPHTVLDYTCMYRTTAMHLAVFYNYYDMAELLLNAGADPFAEDSNGSVPIGNIFRKYLAGDKGWARVLDSPLFRSAYFEFLEHADFSDLHQVIIGMKPMAMKTALGIPELCAQATKANRHGSPMRLAVIKGDLEWVKALLRLGIDPDDPADPDNYPVLQTACLYGHPAVARALLSAGANPNSLSRDGSMTPLGCAVLARKREVVPELFAVLAESRADFNMFFGLDPGPAIMSAINKNLPPHLVRLLIRHGTDVDVENAPSSRVPHNLLSLAVDYRRAALFELILVEGGADPAFCLRDGRTLLHHLAQRGSAAMMRTCRDSKVRGLDVAKRDAEGKTPLDYLEERNDDDVDTTEAVRDEFMGLLAEQELGMVSGEACDSDDDEEPAEFYDAQEILEVLVAAKLGNVDLCAKAG